MQLRLADPRERSQRNSGTNHCTRPFLSYFFFFPPPRSCRSLVFLGSELYPYKVSLHFFLCASFPLSQMYTIGREHEVLDKEYHATEFRTPSSTPMFSSMYAYPLLKPSTVRVFSMVLPTAPWQTAPMPVSGNIPRKEPLITFFYMP